MRSILLVGALFTAACQNDAPNGELRLTTASPFTEIEDINAPFAVGRVVPIFLADEGSGDPLSQLTISIEPQDTAQIIALGSATFGVILETAGEYTLSVLDAGTTIETATITAEEIVSLRVSNEATIRSIKNLGAEDECSKFDDKRRFDIEDFTLHQNQELSIAVTGIGASGEPLLGLLGLSASTDAPITLDAINLAGENIANGFNVSPAGALGAPVVINFEENPSTQTLTVTIETSSEDESFICL